nr:pentapeptide repeat-containing protein [uncultured Pseudodesulfovibrio sp.]
MVCSTGKKYDGWCAEEEIVHWDLARSYCIYHAPSKPSGADKFEDALFSKIKSTPEGDTCDLRGTIFPHDISFSFLKELPPMDLSSAEFHGEVSFKGVTFKGRANFQGASFFKKANFRGVTFNQRSTLNRVFFSGLVDFKKATFQSGADFWNATFSDDVLFVQTVFNGSTAFAKCIFEKEARFERTEFERVRFDKAYFKEHVYFIGGGSSGRSSFLNCEFAKSVHFVETHFVDADYSHMCPGSIAFFKEADLRRSFLKHAPIESFRFSACNWPIFERRRCIYDARKVDDGGFFAFEEQGRRPSPLPTKSGKRMKVYKPPNSYVLEDLFRRLKKNARDESDEVLASDRHYFEKEIQRKRLRTEKGTKTLRSYLLVYKWLSGYGESPVIAMWLLVLFALLPFVVLGINDLFQTGLTSSVDWGRFFELLADSRAFLPFAKHVDSDNFNTIEKIASYGWPIIVALQATLFSFAVRNKLRR